MVSTESFDFFRCLGPALSAATCTQVMRKSSTNSVEKSRREGGGDQRCFLLKMDFKWVALTRNFKKLSIFTVNDSKWYVGGFEFLWVFSPQVEQISNPQVFHMVWARANVCTAGPAEQTKIRGDGGTICGLLPGVVDVTVWLVWPLVYMNYIELYVYSTIPYTCFEFILMCSSSCTSGRRYSEVKVCGYGAFKCSEASSNSQFCYQIYCIVG